MEKDALYEEIGRLKVELDWLTKKVTVQVGATWATGMLVFGLVYGW